MINKRKYVFAFFHRGLIFGGFGPIVTALIIWVVSMCVEGVSVSGRQMLLAVVSTYALAFIQAGASVFNQIEHWTLAKSLLAHLGTLYVAYIGCYLLNSWIPFNWTVIIIFTAVFLLVYFAVWLTVFFSVKATTKSLNKMISDKNA